VVYLIEWLNFIVLIVSTILLLLFYVKSAGPAQLEKKIGDIAYTKCRNFRLIASAFEGIIVVNYIIYVFYPLPIGLPLTFPWDYLFSFSIACVLLIPACYLLGKGMRDAGEETIMPKKEHALYSGIYDKVRHPQAIGEAIFWFPIALWLNSPFLFL
jgi:protein-S-isoprenylcysteine O-methyltransferase Ste14